MKEWEIQAYVSRELYKLGILHHGDQNAGKRGPRAAAIAKATGMCPGWPDMVIAVPNRGSRLGRMVYIEFKTKAGKVSKIQEQTHMALREHAQEVYVIYAEDGIDAWVRVKEILDGK